MVPYVRLVFTTLAILDSISIVSPQDELEHGLATDCLFKGMKTNHSVKRFHIYFNNLYHFLGAICGDKCLDEKRPICVCGDRTFSILDHLYCCIPRNETCVLYEAPGRLNNYSSYKNFTCLLLCYLHSV